MNINKKIQQQKNTKKPKRKSTSLKTSSYLILAIVVVAFVGAPLVSIGLRGNTNDFIFGQYGNKKIDYKVDNYFAQSIQNGTNSLEKELDQTNLDSNFLRYVWRNAFDNTVMHYALLDAAKKAHYKISKSRVNKSIVDLPFLQKNDKFNVTLYNSLSTEQKKSLTENQTNIETTFNVYKDLTSLISVSKKEEGFFKRINSQTRSFKFARVEKNEIEDTAFITKYGKDNKKEFISYTLKSITLQTKQEAISVLNKITAEEITFENAAKTYSTDGFKEQEGLRENLFAYQISQQDGDDVLAAIKNINTITEISPIIETLSGDFAFYQLSTLAVNPDFADEKIQNTVKNYLLANDPNIVEDQKKLLLEQFASTTTPQNFETTAKTMDLETGKTNKFPINVGNTDALTKLESESTLDVSTFISKTEILSTLFSLKQDEYSNPFTLGNHIYIFLVSTIDDENNEEKSQDADVDTDTGTATDTDTGTDTGNENTLLTFVKKTQEDSLRTAVVMDEKLTDNFETAFTTIYPPNSGPQNLPNTGPQSQPSEPQNPPSDEKSEQTPPANEPPQAPPSTGPQN